LQGVFTGNNRSGKFNNNQSEDIGSSFSLPLFITVLGPLSVALIIIGIIISTIITLFFDVLFFAIYDDRREGIN